MMRERVLFAIALVAGTALWLALVPNDDPNADARNPAYWWLAIGVAVVLGALMRSNQSASVGAAVAVPALALAPWTAPRGDNDGLWVLWFPFLFGFLFLLAGAGATGAWMVGRRAARRERGAIRPEDPHS